MPGIGIKAIDQQFILGLGKLSGSTGAGGAGASSGSSDAARIRLGLRSGASLYANAVGTLNNLTSALNIARDDLEKLQKMTDEAIRLSEKATKIGTSNSQRSALNEQFQKIGKDFRRLIENAEVDDKQILTRAGLEELFVYVGLDKEASKRIADVFENFIVAKEDTDLASEEMKGKALKLPQPVTQPTPSVAYGIDRISDNTSGAAIQAAFVTSVNSIYQNDDNEIGANPSGFTAPIIESENGSKTTLAGPIGAAAPLLAASETSGYSLIRTNANLLGYNDNGVNQLYVVGPDGTVLHQATAFADNYTINAADISSDGKTVTFITTGDPLATNADGSAEVFMVKVGGALGAVPDMLELTQVSNHVAGTTVRKATVSEDGQYVAFRTTGGTAGVQIYDSEAFSTDTTLASDATITDIGGFIGGAGLLAITDGTNIYSFGFGDPSKTLEQTATSAIGVFAASESGYVAYKDGSDIYIDNLTAARTSVYTLVGGENVNSISVTQNGKSTVDVGILGQLDSQGQTDRELYRIRELEPNTAKVLKKPEEVQKIFDGTITRRENAFRSLNDLKALSKQIEENLKALDGAIQTLRDNVDLVRATGLAMLEISDQINTEQQAGDAARQVQAAIRRLASFDALKQGENLESIATAALVQIEQAKK